MKHATEEDLIPIAGLLDKIRPSMLTGSPRGTFAAPIFIAYFSPLEVC